MTKLSQQSKDFMALIQRSRDLGDGWRKVSELLVPAVKRWGLVHPELYEIRDSPENDTGLQIRLTQRGLIVAEYL